MNGNEELAWMAGIVDGEGSIMIQKVTKKSGLHPEYRLILRVNVSVGQDLSRFSEKFGSKIYPGKAPTSTSRPYRIWLVYGKTALSVLKVLLPYLVWKKDKAALAISFQEGLKTSRPTLSAEEVAKRELFYLAMKKLNFRGQAKLQEV